MKNNTEGRYYEQWDFQIALEGHGVSTDHANRIGFSGVGKPVNNSYLSGILKSFFYNSLENKHW